MIDSISSPEQRGMRILGYFDGKPVEVSLDFKVSEEVAKSLGEEDPFNNALLEAIANKRVNIYGNFIGNKSEQAEKIEEDTEKSNDSLPKFTNYNVSRLMLILKNNGYGKNSPEQLSDEDSFYGEDAEKIEVDPIEFLVGIGLIKINHAYNNTENTTKYVFTKRSKEWFDKDKEETEKVETEPSVPNLIRRIFGEVVKSFDHGGLPKGESLKVSKMKDTSGKRGNYLVGIRDKETKKTFVDCKINSDLTIEQIRRILVDLFTERMEKLK